ncbi:MAG TPA: DUF3187 family protein, partial [Thermoanaerobaculia bacterium]|nr:DUF3187 family protein [Thermoanaerobaculia bacterium]
RVHRELSCALVLAAVLTAGAGAEDYSLQGPLRERDMTPLHLTRLEMMPTERSEALGEGWTVETDLTHTNTFAKTSLVRGFLFLRGVREPFIAADATALLSKNRDLLYLDGEFGLLATTLHYRSTERLSFFSTLPFYYFTGGVFDPAIEAYHRAFGLGQDGRDFVTQNQFGVVYQVGRERVVEIGAPGSGLSDPILGVRYRLLPAATRWDLILVTAVKAAVRSRGALSTGGSDLGLQLALHRTVGPHGIYLDVSAVRFGGPQPDPRVDKRAVPAFTGAYERGITRRTSAVVQLYISPSVFRHADAIELNQTKFEVLAGIHSQRGAFVWTFDLIENIVHNDNTPDVGAQCGVTWKLGKRSLG